MIEYEFRWSVVVVVFLLYKLKIPSISALPGGSLVVHVHCTGMKAQTTLIYGSSQGLSTFKLHSMKMRMWEAMSETRLLTQGKILIELENFPTEIINFKVSYRSLCIFFRFINRN